MSARQHRTAGTERGGALLLALVLLGGITTLALALLSVGALEPQISRNQVDLVRARYLAEAGLEHAYDILVTSTGWSSLLSGSTCTSGTVLADAPIPGLSASDGRFRVLIRNDCAPGDERLTGVSPDSDVDDHNATVIVTSTGILQRPLHHITAVMADEGFRPAPGQDVPSRSLRSYNWSDE